MDICYILLQEQNRRQNAKDYLDTKLILVLEVQTQKEIETAKLSSMCVLFQVICQHVIQARYSIL